MSETPDPLLVPEDLAPRVRSVADKTKRSADDFLRAVLEVAVEIFDEPVVRHRRWFLGYLRTDDGPTPPAGLDKVLGDFPRWRTVGLRSGAGEDETGGDRSERPHAGEPVVTSDGEPRCEPCLLEREDGVAIVVEVLPSTGRVRLVAAANGRDAESLLDLECPEAWLDFGARVWRRVMVAADDLGDRLMTGPADQSDAGAADADPDDRS